ncbi:hypothetical protein AB1N83_013161, partial [Pleurotus pulmonarius]
MNDQVPRRTQIAKPPQLLDSPPGIFLLGFWDMWTLDNLSRFVRSTSYSIVIRSRAIDLSSDLSTLTTVTVINCHSASMAFKPYGPQYYPGFVMNESKLFFEAEQSDLPRQKTNYCLHVDGMALMKQYGLKLIREWKMPMEIRPVW